MPPPGYYASFLGPAGYPMTFPPPGMVPLRPVYSAPPIMTKMMMAAAAAAATQAPPPPPPGGGVVGDAATPADGRLLGEVRVEEHNALRYWAPIGVLLCLHSAQPTSNHHCHQRICLSSRFVVSCAI